MGAYLSQILADAPGGAASTSGAASSEQLKQTLKTANYLASRGPEGLKALKALCASPTVQGVALPDAWQTRIPLEGACMNGHTDSTMKYLVEDVGVLINLPEEGSGDAPLHSAVAWGRPECARARAENCPDARRGEAGRGGHAPPTRAEEGPVAADTLNRRAPRRDRSRRRRRLEETPTAAEALPRGEAGRRRPTSSSTAPRSR